ncbi:proteasome regulatory particle subunit [Coemansia sp. RSA 2523]|nr:proteasome regulatory particle subunit [Coemansia sp. RSA 1938]KAJ1807690.1 proteasome regulatory particle subunit [Coemansia sp. RSA 2523]KAJ2139892.1 proteasome regulatory particle subunit [Coemansia sp. RSA 788]KAJ2149171.1 proteasome regulatory particle subunit [Coemansia sp. RSA 564]KAJ2169494.1 proteasome regulatory particle subunit [Coemansia sp. RSA 562]KAJ2191726.1 proteasome regulatory particle subunit [Coemansia sp. RSA 532]KAJ2200238.1 proteasome regulatory particle subunit [Co
MADGAIFAKKPELALAQHKFAVFNGTPEQRTEALQKLSDGIKQDKMVDFYAQLVSEGVFENDAALAKELEAGSTAQLAELDKNYAEAKEEHGDLEQNESSIHRAVFFAQIGAEDRAHAAYEEVLQRPTTTLNQKLDIVFGKLRLGLFAYNPQIIQKEIERAHELVNKGGDWDRRNRLKAIECIWHCSQRQFKEASDLFIECLSTFASPELMSMAEFVCHGALACAVVMTRADIKKKVLDAPEVVEVMGAIPAVERMLRSLYECNYASFFVALADVETQHLRVSRYLFAHRRYFTREMRIRAYAQLLESYLSLTLKSMAESFGVSQEFIDSELSRFVAAGRLHCVIDKVGGIVVTNRPDTKNAQYQRTVKQGDLLLNRIQKLAGIVSM